jgi:NADH dehydrogenase
LNGRADPPPFRYFDKGNMAVVGKGFAVLQSGHIKLSGFVPWLIWAAVHLQFLAQSYLRVSVFLQWMWTYLTGRRGSRLIINPPAVAPPLGPANLSPGTLPSQQLSRT